MRIEVSEPVAAPVTRVWEVLSDLPSHVHWMAEAVDISFVTDDRSGIGTVMRVTTKLGPFRTADLIEVVDWQPRRRISVDHKGAVTGEGEFVLSESGGGTVVTWREYLRFPWWMAGPLGAFLVKPILKRIWQGNLRRLAAQVAASGP